MSHHFLTLIETDKPCNKLVTRTDDGAIKKQAGAAIKVGTAVVVPVPDAESMMTLLRRTADEPTRVLMQGFFDGIEPGKSFLLLSQDAMRERLGLPKDADVTGWHEVDGMPAICRLKRNVIPSAWQQLDRDLVPGMPPQLANLIEEKWLAAVASLMPGFADAAVIRVASTSGRVRVDGEPMASAGARYWFQLEDPYDLERLGASMLLNSFDLGLGFERPVYSKAEPERVVAQRHWTIFDPTTFSGERLVFDGQPRVRGNGLTLGAPDIALLRSGGAVDSHLVLSPEPGEYCGGLRLEKRLSRRRVRKSDGRIETLELDKPVIVDDQTLRLETELELQDGGTMSVRDYWRSNHGKLRCQTPFRESASWNGFINRLGSGIPFVFDNGTRIRYDLHPDDAKLYAADATIARLEGLTDADVRLRWVEEARSLDEVNRTRVMGWVANRLNTGINPLKAELRAALDKRKDQARRRRNESVRQANPHRVTVDWDAARLPEILGVVEDVLFRGVDGHEQVMSLGGELTRVATEPPATVRQIQRLHAQGEGYPPVKMLKAFQQESLRLRLMRTFNFFETNGGGKVIGIAAPTMLVNTMLEESPQHAPACTGLLLHPCVRPDGVLLHEKGLDPGTGLYVDIPSQWMPELPREITQSMAVESLQWLREELLADWPFETPLDRDVAVVMFLTGVQRKMIADDSGSVGFGVVSPQQASGKTALMQLYSYLLYNRPVAAQSWTQDQTEMSKLLVGLLKEGHPHVLFDNVNEGDAISGNELSKAMTAPRYQGRRLGANATEGLPTQVMWTWTGNNVTTEGDFNTRVALSYINPGMERPDQRHFSRRSLADWADAHRAEFFYHALIIIAGGIRAHRSGWKPSFPPSRFKDWTQQVLTPMEWAGGLDVGNAFERNMQEDEKGQERAELLRLWHEMWGDEPKLAKDVVEICENPPVLGFGRVCADDERVRVPTGPTEEERARYATAEQLRDLVPSLFRGGKVTTRKLGKLLAKIQKHRYGGYWIERCNETNAGAWWRVCHDGGGVPSRSTDRRTDMRV